MVRIGGTLLARPTRLTRAGTVPTVTTFRWQTAERRRPVPLPPSVTQPSPGTAFPAMPLAQPGYQGLTGLSHPSSAEATVSIAGPLIALTGVVVGAVLSYVFALLGESRRERWALSREWRERRLHTYGAYVTDVKRMRTIAERIAADVGIDDQAPPLSRSEGLDQLAEANMARGASFEALVLMANRDLVEAARALNRAVWRLEWFARGLLDDSDVEGWHIAAQEYFEAVNLFHQLARKELGVTGEFSRREAEVSPRDRYEQERQTRASTTG